LTFNEARRCSASIALGAGPFESAPRDLRLIPVVAEITIRFIFRAVGCTLAAFSGYVMDSRAKRSYVHTTKTNPRGLQQTAANARDAQTTKANARATFKLFGQAPMQATILSRSRAGFWIQGGKLAEYLGGCDYSGVEVDVCFLSANKVEWYKSASAGAETGR
jgi:hypothetical protein